MKRLVIATALMLSIPAIALADGRKDDRREFEKDRREAIREADKDRREDQREYLKDRREFAREYDKDRRKAFKEQAKARREWARGQYIPREYLVDRYYIRDYDRYDLAPPPRGYGYVRPYEEDERYYLVQLATGVISQILGR